MTPQRSSLAQKEFMPFGQAAQDGSSSVPFAVHEPWQHSARHHATDATISPYPFNHSPVNLLAPDGSNFSTFDGMSSNLPRAHKANSFMPEEADGFYLQEGLVEASLQYGLPKASPGINGEVLLSQPWNHDMHTEVGRPATDLSAISPYGAMPVAPGFDHFNSVLTDLETYRMPPEQTSPSQYSSVTGSLSTIAGMDSSRRSSIVYSSGSNAPDQGQSDTTTHTTPVSQPEPNPSQTPPTMAPRSQRQRSRGAAIKCREKTKAAMAQLEATERAASLEHMELSKTVADLREEVLALKNQLLLHGNCNCDVIQQYLRNAARSIGEGSSVNYASSQGRVAAWTNPPGLGRHHSFS